MTTRRALRETKRLRSRRVRAILAGGLVLGVGAAVTLAAWNDSEHSSGTFTASRFGIVGSTNGTAFAEHPSTDPAALSFTVAPTAMSPGTTTYALFSVKTTAASTVGGKLLLSAGTPTGTGLGSYLRYGVSTITGTTCDGTAFSGGTAVVATGSALTVGAAPTVTQAVAANGGSTVNYCFAVTLPAGTVNDAQGLNATQTWTITGTSD